MITLECYTEDQHSIVIEYYGGQILTMNLTIKDLPGNEELFFEYLDKLEKNYKGKNLDWIPYLRRDWEKYIFWTLFGTCLIFVLKMLENT